MTLRVNGTEIHRVRINGSDVDYLEFGGTRYFRRKQTYEVGIGTNTVIDLQGNEQHYRGVSEIFGVGSISPSNYKGQPVYRVYTAHGDSPTSFSLGIGSNSELDLNYFQSIETPIGTFTSGNADQHSFGDVVDPSMTVWRWFTNSTFPSSGTIEVIITR